MKKISTKKTVSAFIVTISLLGIASFFLLQKPATSELRFKEHSLSLGKIGNVLPASCGSNVNHSAPGANPADCDQICINSTNVLVASNTSFSYATGSCVCKNGKVNPPVCDSPKVILTADNLLQPSINSFTADNNDLNYGGSTYLRWSASNASSCNGSWGQTGLPISSSYFTGGLRVSKLFTLTCYNGAKQSQASVQVGVDNYEAPPCRGCSLP